MELRHLRYFVAVAEEKHFGRAASRLNMAQPPLSQQIKGLESELGVQLFRRSTRRVDLTDAGEAYLVRARAVLAEVEDAGREVRAVAAGTLGRLVVACVGSATYSLLPRLARGLAEELPGIDFEFRGEVLVPDQVQHLAAGSIDIALLRPPVHDPGLCVVELRRDLLLVAVAADDPLAQRRSVQIADLAGRDLVAHAARSGSVMRDLVVKLCRESGFEPRIRAEVDETSTLVALVAGGLGAAILPAPVTSLGLAGVSYLPLAEEHTVPLAVAYRADRGEAHLHRAINAIQRLATDR